VHLCVNKHKWQRPKPRKSCISLAIAAVADGRLITADVAAVLPLMLLLQPPHYMAFTTVHHMQTSAPFGCKTLKHRLSGSQSENFEHNSLVFNFGDDTVCKLKRTKKSYLALFASHMFSYIFSKPPSNGISCFEPFICLLALRILF